MRREVIDEFFCNADGACAWAASAVRSGEGLVEIDVDDVETEIAGPGFADDGVEVCAVVICEAIDAVNQVADLFDVRVEKAQRIGVGEHKARDFIVEEFFKGGDIHHAFVGAGDGHDFVAGDGGVAGFVP